MVRNGSQVFAWGDVARRGDIASAAKPLYSHFLLLAVERGKLSSVDVPVITFEPRLKELNPRLEFKDRGILFRHCANQTSCYGVSERPGTAYNYNDFQMALFWDALFRGVYGAQPDAVDEQVFRPLLTDPLGCQDEPTMLAFGPGDRAGRVAISPRDHCRFGLLYLRGGKWNDQQLLSAEHVRLATGSPLPLSIPRTKAQETEMIPGQRTIGSKIIPDDHNDHDGCYSWLWWVNGQRRSGRRLWPAAPASTFAALGHQHGKRGLAVIPEWDMVLAWNDTTLDKRSWDDPANDPHPLNEVFRLLKPSE